MSDATRIKKSLRERVAQLARYLFPNGKREGNHWCVADITGAPGKSFKICIADEKAGLWGDFANAGKHSRNLLDLWMAARGVGFKTALRQAAEWLDQPLNEPSANGTNGKAPIPNSASVTTQGACGMTSGAGPKTRSAKTFRTLDEAIAVNERLLKMRATRRDAYHDPSGNEHLIVVRFDGATGKQFRPFSQNGSGWAVKDPLGKLSLFRLPQLNARPSNLVFIVEGEKCACELAKLGLLVTTSAHGANSAHKTDWQSLSGREVGILPDNDPEGRAYAQTVAGILNQLSPPAVVKIVHLPNLPPKGDCADWLSAREAQTPEDITAELLALVENAKVIRKLVTVARIGNDIATRLNSRKPKVELPGNGRLLSKFAAEIADYLKTCGLYERGGVAVIPNQQQNGLEVITPQMLRTLVENHLVCYRVRHAGESEISFRNRGGCKRGALRSTISFKTPEARKSINDSPTGDPGGRGS